MPKPEINFLNACWRFTPRTYAASFSSADFLRLLLKYNYLYLLIGGS